MKAYIRLALLILLSLETSNVYSQITITDIEKKVEEEILMPEPYDSLKNWEYHEKLSDYRQYIGLQMYLPPIDETGNTYLLRCNGQWLGADEVNDKYYTILNVYYTKKLDSIFKAITQRNLGVQKYGAYQKAFYGQGNKHVFLVKNDKTNDSLICFNFNYINKGGFTLVPYFLKQQQLFKNNNVIYTQESKLEAFHIRYEIKYETTDGKEAKKYKPVIIEPKSKWSCKDVTLLKPSYDICYIFQNDKGEQVTIGQSISKFMTEKTYLKSEADKKLQREQLLAQQKREEQQKQEAEKKAYEKRKADCIAKYGQQIGESIAKHKVKLGMTLEMCKTAWGSPLWTSKTTNEYGAFEHWYYWLGYSLTFKDGVLKEIHE